MIFHQFKILNQKNTKKIGLNILSVGHLTHQKDYSTTFKALKILKKKM